MKKCSSHATAHHQHSCEDFDKELDFLAAWENGILPRLIDAATILRVRQIRRVITRETAGKKAVGKKPAGS